MKKLTIPLLTALLILLAAAASADVYINEIMTDNGVYQEGLAPDWVELHNDGSSAVHLAGWHLSDGKKNLKKYVFPDSAKIPANGYLLVYCTSGNRTGLPKKALVAPFSLKRKGETLTLSNGSGDIVHSITYEKQFGNTTSGFPNGSNKWQHLDRPTPMKPNPVRGFESQMPAPALTGGFFSKEASITITGEGQIRYTTDGSTPTEKSKIYQEPFTVRRTSVIRARAFSENALPSPIVAATYLIGEASPVPIVSLITDSAYLYDSKTGAMAKGSGKTPNYMKELEYPMHMEYFDPSGNLLCANFGTFTMSGHSARINAQKSIALYARSAYGDTRFRFNPFPHRDYDSYKSLLLRSANSDAYSTRLRDPFISGLSRGMDLLYQDAVAVQVFINGEYWGHYNLREKINKHFVAQWENVSDDKEIDSIDILARTGTDPYVQNGSNADWLDLMAFCAKNDLNQGNHLQYVLDRLDVDNFFRHTIFEMIIGNKDMTNVRIYRVPGGKWKYLLFDVEAGMMSGDEEPMSWYLKPRMAKRARFQHIHLTALLEVPAMRERFLTLFAETLKNQFTMERIAPQLDTWETTLRSVLPRHIARWKNLSQSAFDANVNAVRNYCRIRPKKVIDYLAQQMRLTREERQTYFSEVEQLFK